MHQAIRSSKRSLRPLPAVFAGALCAVLLAPATWAGETADAASPSTIPPGGTRLLAQFRADAARAASETATEVTRDLARRLRRGGRSGQLAAELRLAREQG